MGILKGSRERRKMKPFPVMLLCSAQIHSPRKFKMGSNTGLVFDPGRLYACFQGLHDRRDVPLQEDRTRLKHRSGAHCMAILNVPRRASFPILSTAMSPLQDASLVLILISLFAYSQYYEKALVCVWNTSGWRIWKLRETSSRSKPDRFGNETILLAAGRFACPARICNPA